MKRLDLFVFYELKRILYKIIKLSENNHNLSIRLGNKKMLENKEVQTLLLQAIKSNSPFFAGRLGGFELAAIVQCLENRFTDGSLLQNKLITNAGFFGADSNNVKKFTELYLRSLKSCDLLGRHWNGMEDYIIRAYSSDSEITNMFWLEPWFPGYDVPWTYGLSGKKVLVIHPFEESILSQYEKRRGIFKDQRILPDFELITLKAVQTISESKDSRFNTWFEALDYMEKKALNINFDVAIIGCGAYGFPLAAKIKDAGKIAIHLGGATQLLFGIKGKRWESEEIFSYVKSLFNENWIYPLTVDNVTGSSSVENGCYWGDEK